MNDLPTLYGPRNVRWDRIGRKPILCYPLVLRGSRNAVGEWVDDDSIFIPQTYPPPLPDYSPIELAKMEAAQIKRAARELRS